MANLETHFPLFVCTIYSSVKLNEKIQGLAKKSADPRDKNSGRSAGFGLKGAWPCVSPFFFTDCKNPAAWEVKACFEAAYFFSTAFFHLAMPRHHIYGPRRALWRHYAKTQDYWDVAQAVLMDLNYHDVGQSKGLARRTANHIAWRLAVANWHYNQGLAKKKAHTLGLMLQVQKARTFPPPCP